MLIISHRGLDLDRSEKWPENSIESFDWALRNEFAIELDLQVDSQGEILIAHDSTAERWSDRYCKDRWNEIPADELAVLQNKFGALCWLKDVFNIAKARSGLQFALHLKGVNQTNAFLKALQKELSRCYSLHKQILIFDLHIEMAKELRAFFPELGLAPSVSRDEDIQKYNHLTNGTLYSADQILNVKKVYDWVWLDEWSPGLYNEDIFTKFKTTKLKTIVVSPELHQAENHEDAKTLVALEKRWLKLIELEPDAICTDYPLRLAKLLGHFS